MLIDLLGSLYGPDVIAAFSGASVFILTQKKYSGIHKIIAFMISFFMGVVGANTVSTLISQYLPGDLVVGDETGAFFTSALIVNLSIHLIDVIEIYFYRNNRNGG